ncbi:PD-(D/E)XK nuclease family protein [Ructibacterium gallinarum]|uniref:Exodeoxyribonuclease V subunit gamma n=1 Tax=Ructibacterium gallinarum TaxID=2779355 RepID=A0A9D5R9M5_9FIRM|nr:PD-(D/E)XK nuclease family protein [Ructibacterium gallinarum]MBE5040659.1 exodeoxyribonuclease V subunit gamma [Ructibacterium gallinarum]
MLELMLGPSGAGKTQMVYEEIAQRLERNKMSWILVPEQFSLFTEKEVLRQFGLPAQTRVKVISFSRLCNMVFHRLGPLRMRYIDGAGRQLIASRTLQLLEGKLKVMSRNARQKGFSKVLAETVSECKRYGVSPQTLRFAASQMESEELADKLEDLALLYETYHGLIEEQSADAEDNLTLICPRLKDCDFLEGKLYIRYFRSFTPVEYRAIGGLLHRMDLCVVLDYSSENEYRSLFQPVANTIRRLRETAEQEEIEEKPVRILDEPAPEGPLTYLRRYYFAPWAKTAEGVDAVGIYESQTRYRETEAAADLVLRLCRTEGYRFRDILVLTRDEGGYDRILPAVFARRGIRVFLDVRRSIAAKPMIRLLGGILDILAYGYSYERVMAIAGAELMDLPRLEVDELENYILAAAPSHAMWNAEAWDYMPGRGDFDLDRINHARNVLLSGVRYMEEKISGTKTGGEISTALLDWIRESGLDCRVEQKMSVLLQAGRQEEAEEYRQVYQAAESILAQLSAVMKDTPLSYRGFAELFHEACGGVEVGMIPQTLDCVTFSRIDRFRSSGAKAVLVLGMNEGVFPKGHMTEGLLSDTERMQMKKMGIELAPGREAKRREEQLLIYAVLAAPREKLFFFRYTMNEKGEAIAPSGILKRVQELLSDVQPVQLDGELLAGTEGCAGAFDLLAAALAEYGGRAELLPGPLKELHHWFSRQEEYKQKLEHLHHAITSALPERLTPEMTEKLYGRPLMLSASQLETYNGCAFRYFLTYGLLLREREHAGAEPRSMGSVQHAALYRYFTELKQSEAEFSAISQEECFARVGEAVEEEAKKNAELLYESSAYYQYIVMQMKGIAARTAWEVVKFYRSSAFRPYGYELKIGTGGPVPALTVEGETNQTIARVRGLIDRVDTCPAEDGTWVSVIDYKSSAKNLEIELVKDGITLQPLLYTDAVCRSIPGAVPAAMVYMQMNDPILDESKAGKNPDKERNKQMQPRGWIVNDAEVISAYSRNVDGKQESYLPSGKTAMITRQEIEERIEMANANIKKAAASIAGGEIGAHPYQSGKHDACAYCMYSGICRTEKKK